MKKLAVKFEGNEILSIDDFDIFTCYRGLWKTASEKKNAVRQGIISVDGCIPNCIKLRINAGDKSAGVAQDKAIADAYGNKFIIPLDFEMLGLFGKRRLRKRRPKTQKTKTQKKKTQKTKTQKTKTQKMQTLRKRKHAVCELLAAGCRSHSELRVDMRVANNFAFCSHMKFIFGTFVH